MMTSAKHVSDLGLSASANIIRDHAGWISVQSNPREGPAFSIVLLAA